MNGCLGLPASPSMFSDDRGIDSAADVEISSQAHEIGRNSRCQVAKNLIGYGFVENTLVAKRPDVVFQRLQFDTQLIGNVLQVKNRKIRLSCARAEAGKFGHAHAYDVGPRALGVLECLQNKVAGIHAVHCQVARLVAPANHHWFPYLGVPAEDLIYTRSAAPVSVVTHPGRLKLCDSAR